MLERLLVPVDGSACSEESARLAIALASRAGSELLFLNVAYRQPVHGLEPHGRESALYVSRGRDILDHFMRLAHAKGVTARASLRESGTVAGNIIDAAEREGCDLIVMGTHGREGIGRALMGSVAERVARSASTPVLLARAHGAGRARAHNFDRLLVPLDGSALSALAVDTAAGIARKVGGRIDLLHVIPDLPLPPARLVAVSAGLDEIERDLRHEGEAILAGAKEHLEEGILGKTIIYEADGKRIGDVIARVAHDENSNLVVMGTHGRGGIDRLLLGSVAERVAHRTEMPVMLVRNPPGAQTPGAEDALR
jgi:nucleotide-binding universal stress UspA family protein